jgi:hypothetical protein
MTDTALREELLVNFIQSLFLIKKTSRERGLKRE